MVPRKTSGSCTINDVAKAAGVSGMSVSLAFRGSPRVSEATREKIFAIAEKLHYVPNQAARQLRCGQTDMVGFLVQDFSNPFHSLMMKHAESAFNGIGMSLIFGGSSWNPDQELRFVEKLVRMRVRGVLLCPTEKNAGVFSLLDSAEIPHVALDSVPDDYDGYCVVNDLEMCGRLVGAHFLALGARKAAYIDASPDRLYFSAFTEMRKAFEGALEGVDCRPVSAGMTMEAGAEAFRSLNRKKFDCDAVFCVNDLCALGFMNEAEKHGFRAGKDFALAGIDDMAFSSMNRISLTTVRQPYDSIAEKAFRMLCSLMNGETPPKKKIVLPQTLKIRNTTKNFKP